MKRFKAIPKTKHYRWAKWNAKLRNLDLIIDLADIKAISKRAYATGKVSPKVRKKWLKRGNKSHMTGYCYARNKKKCQWLPATAIKAVGLSKWQSKPTFWWRCLKCGSITSWVWSTEVSEPLLNAYREHTRVMGEESPMDNIREKLAQRFAAMQTPEAKAAVRSLFEDTPEQGKVVRKARRKD